MELSDYSAAIERMLSDQGMAPAARAITHDTRLSELAQAEKAMRMLAEKNEDTVNMVELMERLRPYLSMQPPAMEPPMPAAPQPTAQAPGILGALEERRRMMERMRTE